MKKLCIYHGNCTDGFGAAWVVRKALKNNVEFFAGIYGEEPPDVLNREVIMVDFSYKRSVLLEMAKKAKSILIIDHHKSARDDLVDIQEQASNITCVFDMEHSGAMLTWNHFFPAKNPHKLLRHIEDRDLWRFNLIKTREIQAGLFSYPYDFKIWDGLMKKRNLVALLADEGSAINRKHLKDINELLPIVTRNLKIGGHIVPVANLPYTYGSDAGNILAQGQPFAGYYYETKKGVIFGLRSSNDGLDVAEIATQYGGGGHKHASGFRVSFDDFKLMEVNDE